MSQAADILLLSSACLFYVSGVMLMLLLTDGAGWRYFRNVIFWPLWSVFYFLGSFFWVDDE